MNDTIAAISTALGEGAIGIIRLSGSRSKEIIEKIFVPRRAGVLLPYRLRLGWIVESKTGKRLDQALVTWMPARGSYTAEEMAEVNCHGGIVAIRAVLRTILDEGTRLAAPGEFTMRAFLNGRMGLSEAEAVLDIIRATGETGLEGAVRQLTGELSRLTEGLYQRLLTASTQVEASLDFPEEVGDMDYTAVRESLGTVSRTLQELIAGAEQGRVMREGLRVVLVGRPNAGKSSLLNALLGEERAIVTPVPGTTRDVLEEVVEWEGLPVRLYDTAGLGVSRNAAEALAIERAKLAAGNADITLLVLDGSIENGEGINPEPTSDDAKTIMVINKSDLLDEKRLGILLLQFRRWPTVVVSAKERLGLDHLKEKVIQMVVESGVHPGESALVSRERHRRLLERALEAVREAEEGLEAGTPLDCIGISLSEGLQALGELLGRNVRQEVLEQIFSEFCIGK